jgi:hypothetical protein
MSFARSSWIRGENSGKGFRRVSTKLGDNVDASTSATRVAMGVSWGGSVGRGGPQELDDCNVVVPREPRLLNGASYSESAPTLDWSDVFHCWCFWKSH